MKAPERLRLSGASRPATALAVEVRVEGQRPPELKLLGEIDVVTLPVLDKSLSAMVDGNTGDVVVDLADVHFIGVAGLETLCHHARLLRQRGDRLVVSSPSALTRRVIDILGVAELLLLSAEEAQPR